WPMAPAKKDALKGADELHEATVAYWKRLMAPAMQIDIPEKLLQNLIMASQVHCMLASRNEADGARIAPWCASHAYGPLESEAQSMILGMDYLGQHEYARRSLDYFIKRYQPAGFLFNGYTLFGTGWHLWTLSEHHELTGNTKWMKQAAAEVVRPCRWIVAQL